MTKFSIIASVAQAEACKSACSDLNSNIKDLTKEVNNFKNCDFKGKAADNAQQYADAVIIPLLHGASALFDDIPIAMNRLPTDYQGKVDHKGWSTKELEEKIKQYEKIAAAAKTLIKNMENAKKQASSMGAVGESLKAMADVTLKASKGGEKLAKEGAKKFKEILKKFKAFDVFSPQIFEEILELQKNLNKGQKVVNSAYDSGANKFNIPKDSDLEWAKDLNEVYAEHQEIKKGQKENIDLWCSKGTLSNKHYGMNKLKNKDIKINKYTQAGFKHGVDISSKHKNGEYSFNEEGRAFEGNLLFGNDKTGVNINGSLLKTKTNAWGSMNPNSKAKGFDLSAHGSIAEANAKAQISANNNFMKTNMQGNCGAEYMSADAFAVCKVEDNGNMHVGAGAKGYVGKADAGYSLETKDKKTGLGVSVSGEVSAGIGGGAGVEFIKEKKVDYGYIDAYQNTLDVNLALFGGAKFKVSVPSFEPEKVELSNLK